VGPISSDSGRRDSQWRRRIAHRNVKSISDGCGGGLYIELAQVAAAFVQILQVATNASA
jgi:hypothetical protein